MESLGHARHTEEVAEHSLETRAGSKPVKQRLRRFDEEKRKIIGEEVHKLLSVGFIKEVHHHDWLANPIPVKKKNGKMRMCVDYTSLNKACPKVPCPLPRIDQIVDSTAGCETLSFLDAYSGYHQIKMKESDQLATSFITPFGMYCYVTMPFGLRNAGATYQRCMLHVFGKHIGSTVEAYVDDIVVKSKRQADLIQDLRSLLAAYAPTGSSSIPKNAFSVCLEACFWATLFPSAASRPTPRKSRPSQEWGRSETSRVCRESRDA